MKEIIDIDLLEDVSGGTRLLKGNPITWLGRLLRPFDVGDGTYQGVFDRGDYALMPDCTPDNWEWLASMQ